jgi:plasmid maintenance system antidote protein VapI
MDLFEWRFPAAESRDAFEAIRTRASLSNTVFERRMELGLSQQEVAGLAKTKQSRVSEIESLSGNVTLDTLDRITKALGLFVTALRRDWRLDFSYAAGGETVRSVQRSTGASTVGIEVTMDHGEVTGNVRAFAGVS